MPTMKIPNQLARDLAEIWAPVDEFQTDDFKAELEPYEIVAIAENRDTNNDRRWVNVYELVIRTKDGKHWVANYDVGKTENQECNAFEYDGPEITFKEVHKQPVDAYVWARVSA